MDMHEMIKSFPDQLLEQYNLLKDLTFDLDVDINRVVIAGMGGSAIAGDITKLFVRDSIHTSVHIVRDYNCVPLYQSDMTLFIISSYSGNTEEALSMYNVAKNCSKKIICVTSGGKLKDLADRDAVEVVSIPNGFQPRAALGYSLMTLVMILDKLDLFSDSDSYIESMVASVPELHSFYKNNCKKDQYAYQIAREIYSGLISIYGTGLTEPIASRFRAQIAENAKLLASHHVLPELNHNEIEGFGSNPFPGIPRHIVWMSDQDDHNQVLKRVRVTGELLEDIGVKNIHIMLDNMKNDFITRTLKLLYLTDWISYYLAEINNVDPVPVDTIMNLKNKMS